MLAGIVYHSIICLVEESTCRSGCACGWGWGWNCGDFPELPNAPQVGVTIASCRINKAIHQLVKHLLVFFLVPIMKTKPRLPKILLAGT
jgi:hypothetical protein